MQRQLTQVYWLKNGRVPGMGPGESSWEGHFVWLAYCGCKANVGPKNTHIPAGAQFIRGLPKRGSCDDVHSVVTTACAIYRRFDPMQFTSLKTCLNLFT